MNDFTNWNAGVTTSAGILLGCVATAAFSAIDPNGVEDVLSRSDWLQFTGTLIGGLMTILAGWLAWAAVRAQIASDWKIAHAADDEAWGEARERTVLIDHSVKALFGNLMDQDNVRAAAIREYRVNAPLHYLEELKIIESAVSPARRVKIARLIMNYERIIAAVDKSKADIEANGIHVSRNIIAEIGRAKSEFDVQAIRILDEA